MKMLLAINPVGFHDQARIRHVCKPGGMNNAMKLAESLLDSLHDGLHLLRAGNICAQGEHLGSGCFQFEELADFLTGFIFSVVALKPVFPLTPWRQFRSACENKPGLELFSQILRPDQTVSTQPPGDPINPFFSQPSRLTVAPLYAQGLVS